MLQAQLRRAAPYGLGLAPVYLHACLADKEAIRELQDSVASMGDTSVPTSGITIKATPALQQRFGDTIQDLVDWGWF